MEMYYAKLIEAQSGKYLYDALNNRLIQLPDSVFEYLHTQVNGPISDEQYKLYIEANGLRDVFKNPDDVEIGHKYTSDYLKRLADSHRQLLILSVTNRCNMDCTYCVYHDKFAKQENRNHSMSFETARKAIDEVLSKSRDVEAIRIGFYGGESLIEFAFMQRCVNYALANSFGIKVTFGVTTNGLLLEKEEIRRYFEIHDFSVLVSMDGPQSINDRYRYDRYGYGVFERVINNLRLWHEENPTYFEKNVAISAVQALPIPEKALDDFFSNFPIRCSYSDLFVTDYFREHMDTSTNAYREAVLSEEDPDFSDKYREEMYNTFRNYSAGRKGSPVSGSFLPGGPCFPVFMRWYVNSVGDYYPCERIEECEEFCIGNVNTGVDFEKVVQLYNNYADVASKKCRGCWAFRLCGRCFKNIHEDCQDLKQNIERNYVYFIDNIKDNKKAMKVIENVTYSF